MLYFVRLSFILQGEIKLTAIIEARRSKFSTTENEKKVMRAGGYFKVTFPAAIPYK